MSEAEWEQIRSRFAWQGPGVYANTAAEGLSLRTAEHGLARYAEAKSRGSLGRPLLAELEQEVRGGIARMLGADPADIAFTSSTSRALDIAVGLVELEPGSNIVMLDSEFPSAIVTGHRLRDEGIELRMAPAIAGGATERELAALVDSRTRAVIVSAVSFITGRRFDIHEFREHLGARRPMLIVDAIQAAGLLELPLDEIDALVFGTYKWLLGPHGLAVVHRDPRTLAAAIPRFRGWRGVADPFSPDRLARHELHHDARRLEDGMPNYLGMAVLATALEFHEELGLHRKAARTADLLTALVEALDARGVPVTPVEADRRVGIVTVPTPHAEQLAARLATRGFHVWGREGVVRISPYLHNTLEEMRALAEQIPQPSARSAAAR